MASPACNHSIARCRLSARCPPRSQPLHESCCGGCYKGCLFPAFFLSIRCPPSIAITKVSAR
ncbi:uncharacterized protein B0I36DRAFT_327975 [Microdochium trichocladiopsis]|uniref:Uncharacterized protein n=1 Tax=Microdochium trichocladiopsis TaxID=1682393 RepID=A0A9P8Y556_9PEZI|nr:uncharacterized protein B0I36DRAFT_327975 [Microdochium trichocladiopsis]KAH7027815.1 hypothetical protein B0I36DRAFT_327975 [Microdochium trichocladiopsis]